MFPQVTPVLKYINIKVEVNLDNMLVNKCCGFVDIRPGLGILSIIEVTASCGQFVYLTCTEATETSKVVVNSCSIIGFVSSCLLLLGSIKAHKIGLRGHMVLRMTEMLFSIACCVLIFISISKENQKDACKDTGVIFL